MGPKLTHIDHGGTAHAGPDGNAHPGPVLTTETTRSHDITAADLLTALAATSEHRGVALRPLADVIGDYGRDRAGAYTAYRRRLGPDAAKLPETFAQVVDDVITFADPALASEVASRAVWVALSARWNG